MNSIKSSYEISIKIEDEKYTDQLIVALVHQGYSVYISYDKDAVCFTATDGEVIKT